MAYPMAKMPTLGEFIKRAVEEYGGQLRSGPQITVPRGPVKPRYIYREHEDAVLRALLPDVGGAQRLMPDVLRSLCVRLQIDPADFGFDLG